MNHKKRELRKWKLLVNFWGILTLISFILTFFNILDVSNILKTLTIVYISILSIFSSIKEFNRWKNKEFLSRHKGEAFIVVYTLIMFIFIILSAIYPNIYHIPTEFTATYLSILGIFAITSKSKHLRIK